MGTAEHVHGAQRLTRKARSGLPRKEERRSDTDYNSKENLGHGTNRHHAICYYPRGLVQTCAIGAVWKAGESRDAAWEAMEVLEKCIEDVDASEMTAALNRIVAYTRSGDFGGRHSAEIVRGMAERGLNGGPLGQ